MINSRLLLIAGAALLSATVPAAAPPPTAAELGLMAGAPPPPDKRVTRDNFRGVPQNRWSYQHMREVLPTRAVPRSSVSAPLSTRPLDLDGLEVHLDATRKETVAAWLTRAYADGFIVLHDGAAVYERYFNGQTAAVPHQMFSVTKSFTGTLALMLIEQGLIDPKRTVATYVPELKATAYGDATVQQVLDMTNSIEYDETYTNPNSDIARFRKIFSSCDGSLYSYLQTLKTPNARFKHGEAFHYVTPDPEVIGWIIRRVTGSNLA